MKKQAIRFLCLLMTLVLLEGLWTTAFAELNKSGKCGDNLQFYYNFNADSVRIWGTGPMYDATDKFDSFLWKECFGPAFVNKIQIDRGVTHIGAFAFCDCGVSSITLPETVTSIGKSAFRNCDSLKQIRIPETVTSIGESAFNGCTMLNSVNIPKGVTKIEPWTFCECDFLATIDLPSGLTSIGDDSFRDSGLTEIVIPNGVTYLGESAFYMCFDLEKAIIPGSVEVIGHGAFWKCSALESVTIGKGVKEIDDYAFHSCKKLTSITIPDTVERIGESAFASCEGLTTVVIPASVKVIEGNAFSWKYGSSRGPEHIYILSREDIDFSWGPFENGVTIYCYRNTPAAKWAERRQPYDDYTIVYLDGDADGNGKINIYDFLRIMQYTAGWSVVIDESADMDANGTIDLEDAILLLQYL